MQYTLDEVIDGILAVLTFPHGYPGEPAMRSLIPTSTLTTIEDFARSGEHAIVQELLDGYRGLVADLQFLREHAKIILHRGEAGPLVHSIAAGKDELHLILEQNPTLEKTSAQLVYADRLEQMRGEPETVYHALCLVMDPNRFPALTLETVSGWSPEQRKAAEGWATASIEHVDHPEVEVPNEPGSVAALRTPDNGPQAQ